MRKVYYIYNPKTRTYDRIYPTVRQRALSYLRQLFVGMGLGAGSFILLLWIFGSPSEKDLRTENSRLLSQYAILSSRLDEAEGVMQRLQQRDDNIYRVMMQADPLPDEQRSATANNARYNELMDMANSRLVIHTLQKMDGLEKKIYAQSKSFDEVVGLCKQHDKMLACIPAIQPVSNKNLKQTASGYGMRVDPIYKTVKFHAGMDFSANIGTPVYATGNGRVKQAGWDGLYGNCIIIDHGFGYVTRYAHLNKIEVKVGQNVARGEVIGQVGSTGKSTGPHLHYEVRVKALKTDKELKLYYSISEVAKMFDVNESLLRYWEKEFPMISPKKTGGNVRQYRKEDIENIRLVYHLVKEKGLTLSGARQRLRQNKEGTMQTANVVERLKRIREELVSMRNELDYLTRVFNIIV